LNSAVQLGSDARRGYQGVSLEGEGPKIVMLCAAFHFEHPGTSPLLHLLPKVLPIPGEQGRMAQGFADLVRLMVRESASLQPGAQVMLRRLTEMLFIQVIRVWIDQQAE